MIESTHGIILRTRPFTETSLIVNWLTAELGRISTIAKGARRPKSPFLGKLDLFYEADFSFLRSPRSELHTLREVNLRTTHSALRQDLGYLRQACYCAALIEQTTERETPLPMVFRMLSGVLLSLPKHPPQPQTILAFELKLLDKLGLKPELAKTRLTPGTKNFIARLVERDWPDLFQLKLSTPQTQEIQQFLGGFLIYHLERIPAGRSQALKPTS